MSTADAQRFREEITAQEYVHHVPGGHARALARRAADRTFPPNVQDESEFGSWSP